MKAKHQVYSRLLLVVKVLARPSPSLPPAQTVFIILYGSGICSRGRDLQDHIQIPAKKSTYLNPMSTWLLKPQHIVYTLTQLVNLSFQTGVFPSLLKKIKSNSN